MADRSSDPAVKPAHPEKRKSPPSYGSRREKEMRDRIRGEFNHGGRSRTLDGDVNPAGDRHIVH